MEEERSEEWRRKGVKSGGGKGVESGGGKGRGEWRGGRGGREKEVDKLLSTAVGLQLYGCTLETV